SAHLRRLVLAGLPLLGPACMPGQDASPVDAGAPTTFGCTATRVYDFPDQSGEGHTLNIGFDRADPRWSDLFAACTQHRLSCGRLCTDILVAAHPMGYSGGGVYACELGCDSQGGA